MNIATALNRKYIKYTVVMLCSLCENNKEHVDAYLLNSELTDDDVATIKNALNKYDITIIPLKINRDDFSDALPRNEMWSIETYYRLMLLDLLPESVDRLMYLDVDLVINKSIEEFYHVDFEGDEIIATDDRKGIVNFDMLSEKQQEMFRDKYEQGYRYFCAGVMLLNIAAMREKYNFKVYMQTIKEWNYEMTAPDQDILNYAHWQHVGYVDWREYDLFARKAHNMNMTYKDVSDNVAIVHFAGAKPWNCDNCHYDIEQLWWDYAAKTDFYVELLKEFQADAMTNKHLESWIGKLLDENKMLRENVNKLTEINEKLMALANIRG